MFYLFRDRKPSPLAAASHDAKQASVVMDVFVFFIDDRADLTRTPGKGYFGILPKQKQRRSHCKVEAFAYTALRRPPRNHQLL